MSGRTQLLRALGAALALVLLVPMTTFAQEGDAIVDMQGLSFVPKETHIPPGATVLWTNGSPLGHTITADDGSFDSNMIVPGDFFTQVFDAPGVYQYYCKPHGSPGLNGMAGVIIVDDPNAMVEELAAPGPAIAPRPRDPNPTEYTPDH